MNKFIKKQTNKQTNNYNKLREERIYDKVSSPVNRMKYII